MRDAPQGTRPVARLALSLLEATHPHMAGSQVVDVGSNYVVFMTPDQRTYRIQLAIKDGRAHLVSDPIEVVGRWVPLKPRAVATSASAQRSAPARPSSRRWEDLSNMERHRLAMEDPAAFRQIYAARLTPPA